MFILSSVLFILFGLLFLHISSEEDRDSRDAAFAMWGKTIGYSLIMVTLIADVVMALAYRL